MKYQVEYTDSRTGATSAIDTITAAEGYTAEQYIEDCRENADQEWIDMLEQGTVELIELPSEKTWWIVDDNVPRSGRLDTENTGTADAEKALKMARLEWESLSDFDRKGRKDFYIILGEADEDGELDWNTTVEEIAIAHADQSM